MTFTFKLTPLVPSWPLRHLNCPFDDIVTSDVFIEQPMTCFAIILFQIKASSISPVYNSASDQELRELDPKLGDLDLANLQDSDSDSEEEEEEEEGRLNNV